MLLFYMPGTKNKNNLDTDFAIAIDFDKENQNPAGAFRTLSELIEAFQELDKHLVNSVESKIEPVIVLEDLKVGSIKSWFKNVLLSVDDQALKDGEVKKVVGAYLVKAKYAIVKFLDGKTEITDQNSLKQLEQQLFDYAKQTGINKMNAYVPVQSSKLVASMTRITESLHYLKEGDSATFITRDQQKAHFNLELMISPESLEDLLTKERIESESEMILKVKKPDYLGDSKWEFRHQRTSITAKIVDQEWLKAFQARQIDVRPGDSLRVKIHIVNKYDHNNELIATEYIITKVVEVIKALPLNQLNMLAEGGVEAG